MLNLIYPILRLLLIILPHYPLLLIQTFHYNLICLPDNRNLTYIVSYIYIYIYIYIYTYKIIIFYLYLDPNTITDYYIRSHYANLVLSSSSTIDIFFHLFLFHLFTSMVFLKDQCTVYGVQFFLVCIFIPLT